MHGAHLNASQEQGSEPLAVMVYFYGGGFTGGANIQYPGHFLAAKGVIVVVPNYRLGVLGESFLLNMSNLFSLGPV
jgi:carboxylesterase type B